MPSRAYPATVEDEDSLPSPALDRVTRGSTAVAGTGNRMGREDGFKLITGSTENEPTHKEPKVGQTDTSIEWQDAIPHGTTPAAPDRKLRREPLDEAATAGLPRMTTRMEPLTSPTLPVAFDFAGCKKKEIGRPTWCERPRSARRPFVAPGPSIGTMTDGDVAEGCSSAHRINPTDMEDVETPREPSATPTASSSLTSGTVEDGRRRAGLDPSAVGPELMGTYSEVRKRRSLDASSPLTQSGHPGPTITDSTDGNIAPTHPTHPQSGQMPWPIDGPVRPGVVDDSVPYQKFENRDATYQIVVNDGPALWHLLRGRKASQTMADCKPASHSGIVAGLMQSTAALGAVNRKISARTVTILHVAETANRRNRLVIASTTSNESTRILCAWASKLNRLVGPASELKIKLDAWCRNYGDPCR